MPALAIDGKDVLVTPPRYPSEEVKKDLGGRWDKERRAWRVAPTSLNLVQLVSMYGDSILEDAPKPVRDLAEQEWGFEGFDAHPDLRARAEDHPRWGDLYPFQREAVEYLVCNPHRGGLLGLSPGLGKTAVACVAMDVLELYKVLILAPITLARNWGREIDLWSRGFRSVSRATARDKDPRTEVVVTNFETVHHVVARDEDGNVFRPEDHPWVKAPKKLKEWIQEGPMKRDQNGKTVYARERITQARPSYANVDWDLVIVDESILFKNRKAVKVGVVQQIAKYSKQVWLLSGSPTAKFRDDLYPQVQTIMPRGFTSYWRFAETFCVVERGVWGWSIEGDRPNVDVHSLLRDVMFVRDQKDVLPDLPEYVPRPIALELNPAQQKAHDSMVAEWVARLEEEAEEGEEVEAYNRLSQGTRLQQITSNLSCLTKENGDRYPNSSVKEDCLVDLLKNEEIEFPLLVWVNFVQTGESYRERVASLVGEDEVAFVHGNASSESQKAARDDVLDRFKEGDLKVLVMQYEVGKFGHTFTKTRTVYYGDRSWNSDSIVQSLRRVRRIGLDHSPVLITPHCPGTIDDLIEQNLEGKFQSISRVSRADLVELLQSIGRGG